MRGADLTRPRGCTFLALLALGFECFFAFAADFDLAFLQDFPLGFPLGLALVERRLRIDLGFPATAIYRAISTNEPWVR